mmetsp:Transcript_13203/g.22210  ORF Transcript_13203/g.22210 Transcript_13203/m.22210 type:complete len:443 (-) Transcript_13203:747-2075(-)|eukprot:CAMPEP_0184338080 /NCGR_PEP_ID=MMETSP1089-20130417/6594_1 /TAXON_ID=38269 ORGANISM="Gloeochaete wittrockiana, Strain SAG46.84" /NCGR_SAMPLE_ID=MMETSP1089 /ASSEMBLY_ACC=CAM_ASM_000445 /LENGTH=442 /DNA_ID=CAMNT_0026664343 /DNA_START=99 /DNA_END=1427 /DNA_ORIENTATION=-
MVKRRPLFILGGISPGITRTSVSSVCELCSQIGLVRRPRANHPSSSFWSTQNRLRRTFSPAKVQRRFLVTAEFTEYEPVPPSSARTAVLSPIETFTSTSYQLASTFPELIEAKLYAILTDVNVSLPFIRIFLAMLKLVSYSIEIFEDGGSDAFWDTLIPPEMLSDRERDEMMRMMDVFQYSVASDDMFGGLHNAMHWNLLPPDAALQVIDNLNEPDEYAGAIFVNSSIDEDTRQRLRALAVARVAEKLKEDYKRQYFVTGDVTEDIYDPNCIFADPLVYFRGFKRYKDNLLLLRNFFEDAKIRLLNLEVVFPITSNVLFSKVCPEETSKKIIEMRKDREEISASLLASGMDPDLLPQYEPDLIDAVMVATWDLDIALRLPWRPRIAISGQTEYQVSITEECVRRQIEETCEIKVREIGRIIEHRESWNTSAIQALKQMFIPS